MQQSRNNYRGAAERRGHILIEIDADIGEEDTAPFTTEGKMFDLKMFPGSDGRGLEWPPKLNMWNRTANYTSFRTGTGTLKLYDSPWDPTGTVPILSTGTATLSTAVVCNPLGGQWELTDENNEYSRYMWGRGFDDPTLMSMMRRFHEVDKVNGERPLVGNYL